MAVLQNNADAKPWVFEDTEALTLAIQAEVRKALRLHKKMGKPIATWKDGKVVWIPAEEIRVSDSE